MPRSDCQPKTTGPPGGGKGPTPAEMPETSFFDSTTRTATPGAKEGPTDHTGVKVGAGGRGGGSLQMKKGVCGCTTVIRF